MVRGVPNEGVFFFLVNTQVGRYRAQTNAVAETKDYRSIPRDDNQIQCVRVHIRQLPKHTKHTKGSSQISFEYIQNHQKMWTFCDLFTLARVYKLITDCFGRGSNLST